MAEQGVLFDARFLDRHAGAIISDTAVAVVELVANAWDAYATEVNIVWPDIGTNTPFSISDNGSGLSAVEFEARWRKIDYDRLAEQGPWTHPPPELKGGRARRAYGRNGRGRHAAFRFSDPYHVRTWRDGSEATFEVRRGLSSPFDIKLMNTRTGVIGHGTEITATSALGVVMPADQAREIIGTRFLADPAFAVSVDGTRVTFDDLPALRLKELDVPVPPHGTAHLLMIDALKADRSTRQHGIAWRVQNRLVGNPGWIGFAHERILDGRTKEAKRFQFIVQADYLESSVTPDWTEFEPTSDAWQTTRDNVHVAIRELLGTFSAERRRDAKATVREKLGQTVNKLPPVGRDRWNEFVDKVVDTCPGIQTHEVEQVAAILANLEMTTSKYGLINRLHELRPGDLEELNQVLSDWTVRTAKIALDEVQGRLKLIEELDLKLRDELMDEVSDLQPLFERSLWVFGPEFESIEFTSNRGMTQVIQKLFGAQHVTGSRLRPDFVIVPDGSVGFYSRDAHDAAYEVNGVSRLVVAEIKKPGVPIGSEQKGQAWRYVKELIGRGLVTRHTDVTCFVLGSEVDETEAGDRTEYDQRVIIRPMAYNTFVKRAEKRMLGLRSKLSSAPFLVEYNVDAAAFLQSEHLYQSNMEFAASPEAPNVFD